MATHKIDELNILVRRRMYREYFEVMDIPLADRRKREKLAEDIDDVWIEILAIYAVAREHQMAVDLARIEREYLEKLSDVLREAGVREEIIQNYLDDVAVNEMEVTQKRYMDDPYWISAERSVEIATNDSNKIWHETEFIDAVNSGKRFKRWITMRDERVRDTHAEIDGVTIPINDAFVVGNSLMMFPGDTFTYGASLEETVNCRCWLEYI